MPAADWVSRMLDVVIRVAFTPIGWPRPAAPAAASAAAAPAVTAPAPTPPAAPPAVTLDELWHELQSSASMLELLADAAHRGWVDRLECSVALRVFACACAGRAWRAVVVDPPAGLELIDVARRYAFDEATRGEFVAAGQRAAGPCGGAGAIGVPRCAPYAYAQLAVYSAFRESPFEAARIGAQQAAAAFGYLAAREKAGAIDWSREPSVRESWRIKEVSMRFPDLVERAQDQERGAQAEELRRLIPALPRMPGGPRGVTPLAYRDAERVDGVVH